MIRMIQSSDAGHAKSYFSDALSKSDYYASYLELAGSWQSRLVERIGLKKLAFFILILTLFVKTNAQNKSSSNNSFPDKWWDCILKVTGTFETSHVDWGYVTPDFDGQGLSCGLIQVNIGQNSFQPFFLSFSKKSIEQYMSSYGSRLTEICKMKKTMHL